MEMQNTGLYNAEGQPTHGPSMRRLACILSFLCLSLSATADDRAELQNLYAAVSALNQEQQSVFQQFQMLQELRRANDRAIDSSVSQAPQYPSGVIPNYADVVQYRKDALRRGEELSQQADQLYAQYSEIGAKKALLQQRIFELTTTRQKVTAEQ